MHHPHTNATIQEARTKFHRLLSDLLSSLNGCVSSMSLFAWNSRATRHQLRPKSMKNNITTIPAYADSTADLIASILLCRHTLNSFTGSEASVVSTRNFAVKIFLRHRDHAVHQIAERISKIGCVSEAKRSLEKSPSSPKESHAGENNAPSNPYVGTNSRGINRIPSDLEIFTPSMVKKPCAWTAGNFGEIGVPRRASLAAHVEASA